MGRIKALIYKTNPFLAVALLALVLRLVFVYSADWLARSDAKDYHEYAFNLMQGNGYVSFFNVDPAYEGFVQRASRPPGYPLLLAALYILFRFDPQVGMLFNVLCEMLTLILLYKMACYYTGKKIALISSVAYALCPTWTTNLMTESPFTLMVMAAVYLFVQRKWISKGGRLCSGAGWHNLFCGYAPPNRNHIVYSRWARVVEAAQLEAVSLYCGGLFAHTGLFDDLDGA